MAIKAEGVEYIVSGEMAIRMDFHDNLRRQKNYFSSFSASPRTVWSVVVTEKNTWPNVSGKIASSRAMIEKYFT